MENLMTAPSLFATLYGVQIAPLAMLLGGKRIALERTLSDSRYAHANNVRLTKCVRQDVRNAFSEAWDALGLLSAYLLGPGGVLAEKNLEVQREISNALYQTTVACGEIPSDGSALDVRQKLGALTHYVRVLRKSFQYQEDLREAWLGCFVDPRVYLSKNGCISRWRKLLGSRGPEDLLSRQWALQYGVAAEVDAFMAKQPSLWRGLAESYMVLQFEYDPEALAELAAVRAETLTCAGLGSRREKLGYSSEVSQELGTSPSVEALRKEFEQERVAVAAATAQALPVAPDCFKFRDYLAQLLAREGLDVSASALGADSVELVVYLEEALTPQELQRYASLPEFKAFSAAAAKVSLTFGRCKDMGADVFEQTLQTWIALRKDYLRSTVIPALDVAHAKKWAKRNSKLLQAKDSLERILEGLAPEERAEVVKELFGYFSKP